MKREQVLAFRLNQHQLLRRLPRSKIERAAASGLLLGLGAMAPAALAARLEAFDEEDLEDALFGRKSLVEVSGPRAAGWLVPTQDFDAFTLGAAPETEEDLNGFIGSARSHLAKNEVSATLAVQRIAASAREALKGKALTQDEIHEEWRKRLPREMLYHCKGCDSWHVHWMLAGAAGLLQAFCYGPMREGESAFVRPEDWLPKARRRLERKEASRELARRYLRYYGPSHPEAFGEWAGLSPRQAQETWTAIESDLLEARGGKKSKPLWILKDDAQALDSPPSPKGARFLPPRDPFLDLRDRETLVEDKKAQSRVWRVLGNPGVVLLDGEVAGIWRAKKKGKALEIDIERLSPIKKPDLARLEEEAAILARLKGAESPRLRLV